MRPSLHTETPPVGPRNDRARPPIFGSTPTKLARELAETLREDMKKRAESAPAASRRADVLRSLGYVRVPRDDGVEYWRRTLDRL